MGISGVRSCQALIGNRYYYDGRVHVIPEFDGVRLITNDTCEFLHKVTSELRTKINLRTSADLSQV